MFGPRWNKVLNDLWGNKTRTLLIVMSIAVGLFAVGTIVSARTILSTEMARSYAAINPASGTIRTVELFDEGFVRSVRAMDEVAEAEARRAVNARVELGPDRWKSLTLFAVRDYAHMRVSRIEPEEGAWPPPYREILIERAALDLIGAQVGDRVRIEVRGERAYELRIAGLAHDMFQVPAQFDGTPYGYVSFDTLAWMGEPYGFNELHVVAARPEDATYTHEAVNRVINRVINRVKDKAERNGLTIPMSMTVQPGMLPLDDILQAVLLLLGTLGLLSLGLSAFLIVNTISALLAQQKRQIGVMKAVGARGGQIAGMYLSMVLIYGLIALALAVPSSVAGARLLSRFLAAMFNFDLAGLQVPYAAVLLQGAVGLLVPVLASLVPFLSNLRVTAAQAMSTYQAGGGRAGSSWIDRLLSGANLWFARYVLLRPFLLSLRNTFRSRGRLALTLATLTLGGAIFIGVFSVRASLFRTIDDLMRWWNFDAMVTFSQPYRVARIEREAGRIPGVVEADVWLQLPVRRVRPDGSESDAIFLFAPRADSTLVPSPVIVEGRWLQPGDRDALVVNAIMLKEEGDIALGDEIVLKIAGRERRWRVVGVCLGFISPIAYADYTYVARLTGSRGQAGTALVATQQHDEASVAAATAALEAHFKRVGLRVSDVQTAAAERSEAAAALGIVISLLLVMAVLLAIVGGLGLMGTMSINVIERTREIGVLRAIGAPNRGVAQVFVLEGIAIGLISWLFSLLLALPLSKLLSDAVGVPLMGASLSFHYSLAGAWLWLAVVVVLSALASFLPARSASRLTVREVLAYE